jgi:hypothetical protein
MTFGALRCGHCGNRTRFDIYETVRRRSFAHYTLGGDLTIEEEEVLESTVERVVCRWCERTDAIERDRGDLDSGDADSEETDPGARGTNSPSEPANPQI